MRKYYSIDRVEGSAIVLIDDGQNKVVVDSRLIVGEVREGEMVWLDGECYRVDSGETERRRREICSLLEELGE